MNNIERVLVASDLSPRADLALSRAWQIAAQHGASLDALHVLEPVGGPGVPPAAWERLARTSEEAEQLLRQEAENILRRQLDHNSAPRPRTVEVRTRVGNPVSGIMDEARERSADLVVLGAHGRRFLRNLLLGTTAESVVRSGECPILVVRKKTVHPYRRVLVPVDFSAASRAALLLVRRLVPKARLFAIHAYDIWYEGRLCIDGTTTTELHALHREYETTLGQRLRAFVQEVGIDSDADSCLVHHGYPGTSIARTASKLHVDLIAIGTRGMSGVKNTLLGSVTEHVLREAPCDVLAVRP